MEKNLTKNCICGEKEKYEVCARDDYASKKMRNTNKRNIETKYKDNLKLRITNKRNIEKNQIGNLTLRNTNEKKNRKEIDKPNRKLESSGLSVRV